MKKSSYLGNRGQAAALDLAIFVAICILALSYLFIQSVSSSASTEFVQENENVNEVAIRALDSLVQSSGADLEIMTLQPVALTDVKSCLSDDVRVVMGYAEKSLEALDDLEKEARSGGLLKFGDPYLQYFKTRLGDISSYLSSSITTLGHAKALFNESSSEKGIICNAIGGLSSLLPGYEDLDIQCNAGFSAGFLSDLSKGLLDASGVVSKFETTLDYQVDALDEINEKTADLIHELRCTLTSAKDSANALLTYLETGVDPGISFMELLPVKANLDKATLGKMLSDSLVVGKNLASSDELRSLAASSALLLVRDKDVGEHLPDPLISGNVNSEAARVEEGIIMNPRAPLERVTNASASGPYNEMSFLANAHLTASGLLAIQLGIDSDATGGLKHKTEYFQDLGYILNSSAYPSSTHYRTYNGSFVKGSVGEGGVTRMTREWTETAEESPEMNSTTRFKEERLLRPMAATVYLTYENLTWPAETYNFDIEHYLVTKESNYTVCQPDCDGYNESDATKSVLLGVLLAGKNDLRSAVNGAVKNRLAELLEGYEYKLEVKDCCSVVLEINPTKEPVGRVGVAKYYLIGDGSRAEMKLTVWRE